MWRLGIDSDADEAIEGNGMYVIGDLAISAAGVTSQVSRVERARGHTGGARTRALHGRTPGAGRPDFDDYEVLYAHKWKYL